MEFSPLKAHSLERYILSEAVDQIETGGIMPASHLQNLASGCCPMLSTSLTPNILPHSFTSGLKPHRQASPDHPGHRATPFGNWRLGLSAQSDNMRTALPNLEEEFIDQSTLSRGYLWICLGGFKVGI